LIKQIEDEVKEKKNRLAPEIKKLRTLRTRYSEIEKVFNEKKKSYDQVSSHIDMERERIDKDIGTQFKDFKEHETKFHQNNIQAEIYDSFTRRIGNEAKHLSNPDKRLSQEFKSYQEFFQAKVSSSQIANVRFS
jgi:intraflagellar transport protein 81